MDFFQGNSVLVGPFVVILYHEENEGIASLYV
jgi:hypothetical protein